jgi:hypothetical protein
MDGSPMKRQNEARSCEARVEAGSLAQGRLSVHREASVVVRHGEQAYAFSASSIV